MIAQLDKAYISLRKRKVWSRLWAYFGFEGRPLTTKGRWINTLVFGFFNVLQLLPRLKRVEQPIFIIGTGRSGTTILGKILSIHKDVGYLNEPKAIWHFAYKNEDINGNYTRKSAKYRFRKEDVNYKAKIQSC